jgi:hypothetical protein
LTLRLNGSTSGYTEIDAPAVAGSNTLVLPSGNGSNQQVLAGNGSGTLSWSNRPILQVVNATSSTTVTSNTSTFADTGLTATITPASSSNKILVMVNHAGCGKNTGNTSLMLILLRNGASILRFEDAAAYTAGTAPNFSGSCSTCYLDSPATTSAVTYKTQFASAANTSSVYVNTYYNNPPTSTITLMEVAA